MCKVLMAAGIKKGHLAKIEEIAKVGAKILSRNDGDGVGYAAVTSKGELYGEKWLNKDEAFMFHKQPEPDKAEVFIHNLLGSMVDLGKEIGKVYDSFGKRQENFKDTVAFILHTRKATIGEKTIDNVHPFVTPGDADEPATALIHNGGILNHAKLTKKMSTCDSEVLLHEYLANQMYHNPWGVENLAKTLTGTYTVGVLSSAWIDDVKVPYLDIFKSNKELFGAFIPEIETMMFCTSDTCLEEIAKECAVTLKNMVKIKDGYLLRINAVTGERMDDIISFTCSPQYDTGWNKQHENSPLLGKSTAPTETPPTTVTSANADEITATGDDDTVEMAKKHFERRHPSLFTMPYVDGQNTLTQVEKDLFSQLAKDNKTDHKALHLVAVALNQLA